MKRHPVAFATVPRLLPDGGTVLVLGSGPSLTQADVTLARAHVDLTIAVNGSYKYAPDAECLYAADAKFWGWHKGCVATHTVGTEKYPAFVGALKYSLSQTPYHVSVLKRGPSTGLTLDPTKVALGLNGCFQSVNVAVHLGASKIVLLGVDMKGSHFHSAHPDRSVPPFSLCIDRFKTLVEPLRALGISIVNCTPQSALKCFPMASLADVFSGERSALAAPVQQTTQGQQCGL